MRAGWDRRAWAQERPDKVMAIDGAALLSSWSEFLRDLGYRDPSQIGIPIPPTGKRTADPRMGALDRDGIADLVISQLGAEHSAWNHADIRGRVEKHLAATGLIVDAAVRLEVAEDITARAVAACVPLLDSPGVPEHVRSLTSQRVLDVEADLVTAMAQRSSHPGTPAPLTVVAADLDEAKREAVAVLAGTGDLVVVEGAAGAGKTTTLAAVRDELAGQGRRMVVVTLTLKAAQVAADEGGIQATTAAGLAHEFGWRWDDDGHWRQQSVGVASPDAQTTALARGDLLLVDEAGMLDQDTAHALFDIADQTGARIALVGDRHQLPAVGRGGVLDLATRWAHPDDVLGLDVVHRFTDPDYARISLAMRNGQDPDDVFDQLWARGQIQLHASEAERLHSIAAEAAERIESTRDGTVVMAETLAQVAVLNGIIRDQLIARGVVDDSTVVTTNAGERIGVGDRVATRLNDHDLGVANRDLWTVTAISPDGSLTLTPASHNRLAGQAAVRDVPRWYVATRVELAYATTVCGAQGETTSTGHLLLSETSTGSAAYVGMTRGRDDNIAHLVAADAEEARALWVGVMGRDRADLGPAHAAAQAAEEMERYAPQRPTQVVLDQLRHAWTQQAELAEQHRDIEDQRGRITEVINLRHQHRKQLTDLHDAINLAGKNRALAHRELKTLGTRIDADEQNVLGDLWSQWLTDEMALAHAKETIENGPGLLGQHRREVRDAHENLTNWARRWQPVMPDLPDRPRELLDHLDTMNEGHLLAALTQSARTAAEQAHPEASNIRTHVTAAEEAAHVAQASWAAYARTMHATLKQYGRLTAAKDLPDRLARTEEQLTRLRADLDAAITRVDELLQAAEIRSLPHDTIAAEHDRWQGDRTAAQEVEQLARQARPFAPAPGRPEAAAPTPPRLGI